MKCKCECESAGFCSRRGCEVPNIHFQKCRAGQVEAIDRVYKFEPAKPERKGVDFTKRRSSKGGVGTALKAKINGLLSIKSGGSCGCNTLAKLMDTWGPDECESRREYIVGRLMENKSMIADALEVTEPNLLQSVMGSIVGWTINSGFADAALRTGANWMLSEAIRVTREQIAVEQPGKANLNRLTVHATKSPRVRPGSAFRHISGPIPFVTSAQFQRDILSLVAQIPPDITAIAGVARSGLSAATMLSMYLHLPMITIRQTMNDIVPTGNGWRLGGTKHVDPKGKILVVDDTVMTGNSLKAIAPLIERELGNAIYAAVYVNPLASRKPDIWAVDLQWPHLLEWNLFNSVLSPSLAVDFDGILCHDCPSGSDDDGQRYLDFIRNAKPFYVPRRVPIPLIVTARIERYRAETEAWLHRYGIRWHRLVMHPAKTLAERQRDDIPAYKARHFQEWAKGHRAAPGPIIFAESEDWQARRIAQLSKMLVICPSTAGVYGG
jgi:adenine/guanine phosphoribosyltransferase-like PRPP-binding protein